MTPAICVMMLLMLPGLRKFSALKEKKMKITASPISTGQLPRLPPRMLSSMRPKKLSGTAAGAAAVASVLTPAPAPRGDSGDLCRNTRRDRADDLVLGDFVPVVDTDVAAEPEHGDPVRDLEDVVQVVRDQDDRQPLIGQPLDEEEPETWSVWATPSAAVGSSRITSREFHITARATATDCRWPPDDRVATGCRIERIVVTARLVIVSAVLASITVC